MSSLNRHFICLFYDFGFQISFIDFYKSNGVSREKASEFPFSLFVTNSVSSRDWAFIQSLSGELMNEILLNSLKTFFFCISDEILQFKKSFFPKYIMKNISTICAFHMFIYKHQSFENHRLHFQGVFCQTSLGTQF